MNMGAMGAVGGSGLGGGGGVPVPDWYMNFSTNQYFNRALADLGTSFHPGVTAYHEDSVLLWSPFATAVPRRNERGLRCESVARYGFRRNDMNAAVVGIIGSGGVAPDNWNLNYGGLAGITSEILAKGSEFGFNYVDIKQSGGGTPGQMRIAMEGDTQIACVQNDRTIISAYLTLLAGGSLSNISNMRFQAQYRTSPGGASLTTAPGTVFTISSTRARYNANNLLATNASTGACEPEFVYDVAGTFDLRYRVAVPDCEVIRASPSDFRPGNTYATSPVISTGTAITRTADNSQFTDPTIVNPVQGTMLVEWEELIGPAGSAIQRDLWSAYKDGSNEFRIIVGGGAGGDKVTFSYRSGGTFVAQLACSGSIVAGQVYRAAVRWANNNFAAAFTAALQTGLLTDTTGATWSGPGYNVAVGRSAGGGEWAETNIRQIGYYGTPLTDTQMLAWVGQ